MYKPPPLATAETNLTPMRQSAQELYLNAAGYVTHRENFLSR